MNNGSVNLKEFEKKKSYITRYRTEEQIKRKRTIALDVETTGFDNSTDEILQLAIVDHKGNAIFDEYFKPNHKIEWKQAQNVHGITPIAVSEKPGIEDRIEMIQSIIDQADRIIGYNIDFDIGFLESAGISFAGKELYDVMKLFAKVNGEWNDYYGDYVWKPLIVCAAHYDYIFKAHDALEDARATMFCYPLVKHDYDNEIVTD